MAEIKVSQLTSASTPLDPASFFYLSKPTGGGSYDSHKALLSDLEFTIGSTTMSIGDTVTTISGLTLVTPAIGTPTSGTLTNCTGLPISTGVSGLGTGIATFLGTPSSANLATAVTGETGSGALVFGTSPAFTTSISVEGTSASVSIYDDSSTAAGKGGEVFLEHRNSGSTRTTYAKVKGVAFAGNVGAEQGHLDFYSMQSGTLTLGARLSHLGRFGIGAFSSTTEVPQATLHVGKTSATARVYNSFTDSSNGEWAYIGDWSGNVARYGTDKNGTGVAREVKIFSGGTEAIRIDTSQQVSIGNAAANSRFTVAGTYTSSNVNFANIAGTHISSITTTQRGTYLNTNFQPSGASLSNLFGLVVQPNIDGGTPSTLTSVVAIGATLTLTANFSGTVSAGYQFFGSDFVVSGGSITNATQFHAAILTTNNNIDSGTRTNWQYRAAGITAGSAGGTMRNRGMEIALPSGGSSSGQTDNYGLYLTGNGGTSSGGTVNNFAIISDSTAESRLSGLLAATELTVRGSNAQLSSIKHLTELTTIAAAASTNTTIQIPVNALVFAVSVRVTTAIPTAATFSVGVSGATTRYGTGISTSINTTSPGTLDALRYYAGATAIVITPNLTPATNAGRVRVTIHYIEVTPPTS